MNGILDKSKEKKVKVPTCLEKKTKHFHKKMIQNSQAQGIFFQYIKFGILCI